MNTPNNLMPGAEPFEFPSPTGSDRAVLLIHGLTGTPSEMRFPASVLNEAGYHVRAPLLPGHGTAIADLNKTTWRDWYGEAERSFLELKKGFQTVFVAGLSMGSMMTLNLLIHHNDDIAAAGVMAPPFHFIDWKANVILPVVTPLGIPRLIGDIPEDVDDVSGQRTHVCYGRTSVSAGASLVMLSRRVKRRLGRITAPVIVIMSRHDSIVDPKSARIVYDRIASEKKRLVMLEKSLHTVTVDVEKEKVADELVGFFRKF
ncbi:MAG: alpha/beta fold hydrolase [Deltaproteobacteria bacterium]|nr:alpha/beta fold hydrolase [Candidatus Zymogenaceae bacterium]